MVDATLDLIRNGASGDTDNASFSIAVHSQGSVSVRRNIFEKLLAQNFGRICTMPVTLRIRIKTGSARCVCVCACVFVYPVIVTRI